MSYNIFRPKTYSQLPTCIKDKIMSYHPMANSICCTLDRFEFGCVVLYFETNGIIVHFPEESEYSFIHKNNYNLIKNLLLDLDEACIKQPECDIEGGERGIEIDILSWYPQIDPRLGFTFIKNPKARYQIKEYSVHINFFNYYSILEHSHFLYEQSFYLQIVKQKMIHELAFEFMENVTNPDLFEVELEDQSKLLPINKFEDILSVYKYLYSDSYKSSLELYNRWKSNYKGNDETSYDRCRFLYNVDFWVKNKQTLIESMEVEKRFFEDFHITNQIDPERMSIKIIN